MSHPLLRHPRSFLPPSRQEDLSGHRVFRLFGRGRVWILAASSENEKQLWTKEICNLIRDIVVPLLQPKSKALPSPNLLKGIDGVDYF